ncbi:hypothetical protein FB45DRAFT_1126979, partial [Roridomyces roridus]
VDMITDIRAIIKSNAPPTDIQAHTIRTLLASSLSELSRLDEQIHQVSTTLVELQQRRLVQQQQVDSVKGALSCIRTVPTEILSEIFLVCRDDTLDSTGYCIFDATKAPLLLTHVSSRWRAVCLSNPNLWRSFHV